MQIILEKTNYQKKYKCPYCDKRDTRQNLVSHIADDHEDMIPKDYTPLRVVFNTVNKKDHGNCIICKGETKWDENKFKHIYLNLMLSMCQYTTMKKMQMVRILSLTLN